MLCTERQKGTSLMKNNINNIQATTNKIEFNETSERTNERVSERAKKYINIKTQTNPQSNATKLTKRT